MTLTIVSSGGFTADAEVEIRRSARHIEKMDLNDFIGLWEEYYDKMHEEDKIYLPLRRVSFLAPPKE
ncbi:MAG: restriction system protein [Thermoanaerobacter sp.]|nr:restriction system protein [Thermoanaerobacter sp.]